MNSPDPRTGPSDGARGHGRAAVVVAHPDDEALWLSSALAGAERTIFCFGDQFERPAKARARRRAVAELDLPGLVNLAIPESGAGFSFDWRNPKCCEVGLIIDDPAGARRYYANFAALREALRPVLAGFEAVYTHNPWGEYGHAEHVQVYRAVTSLQRELGFAVWFSGYVGERSAALLASQADVPLWCASELRPTGAALAHKLRRTYVRHGAWTWSRLHRWPREERLFARAASDHANRFSMRGQELTYVEALRWWPPMIGQAFGRRPSDLWGHGQST